MSNMDQIYTSDLISFQTRLAPAIDDEVAIIRSGEEILPAPYVVTEEGKVRFRLYYPNAQKVELSDYTKFYSLTQDGDFWCGEFGLGEGFIALSLKIDGSDIISTFLPVGYGGNRLINYVDIPEKDFPIGMTQSHHGSVVSDFLESRITGDTQRIMIYLPEEYMQDTQKKFPVLYLLHGHGENEACWISQGKMNFIYDGLISEKKAAPAICVMVNGMRYEEHERSRILKFREMTGFLKEEVIPYVESRYRVICDREHRALAGLSMGSLQTSIAAFEHSELFSYVGVFSGFVQDLLTQNQEHLTERNIDAFSHDNKLFFRGIGEDDRYIEFFRADDEFLEKHDVKCVRRIYKGGHEWKVWRRCFADFVQMIFTEENDCRGKEEDNSGKD